MLFSPLEKRGSLLQGSDFSTLSTDHAIPEHEKQEPKGEEKRYHFESVKAKGNNQTQQRETNTVKDFRSCRLPLSLYANSEVVLPDADNLMTQHSFYLWTNVYLLNLLSSVGVYPVTFD